MLFIWNSHNMQLTAGEQPGCKSLPCALISVYALDRGRGAPVQILYNFKYIDEHKPGADKDPGFCYIRRKKCSGCGSAKDL